MSRPVALTVTATLVASGRGGHVHTTSANAANPPVAGGTYQLVGADSGKCVDVPAASTTEGTLLQQWGCTDNSAWQQFRLASLGSERYQLVNVNSGMCVDVPSGAATAGLQLQQWSCRTEQDNQQWTLTAGDTDTYQVTNVASGLCLANEDGSATNGVAITQDTCTEDANRQWAFPSVDGADITVAADGSGMYTTVQAAVDSVGTGNASEITIAISPGTYREQVEIPSDKPFISLRGTGDSPDDVVVVNNRNAGDHGTQGSATAYAEGHDFTATNLTLSNDFDKNSSDTGDQALALYLNADRVLLDDVRLLGDQDTFYVNNARTYVKNSYVEGTVDFIYGGGIAVFDNCDIYEKRNTESPVTPASTPAENTYGFLFYQSRITGATDNTTSFGRPWRADAQVVYRESELSATIATAQPWTNMSDNTWQNARYFEYQNTGAGATVNGNRPQLSDSEAANYTPEKYLAGSDGWNPIG